MRAASNEELLERLSEMTAERDKARSSENRALAKLRFIAASLECGLDKFRDDEQTQLWYGHMETCRALAAGQVELSAVDRTVGVPPAVRPTLWEQRQMGVEE